MQTRKRSKRGQTGGKKPVALCQCHDVLSGKGCQKAAKLGSIFCKEHKGCPGSPRSGSEPDFEPLRYNGNPFAYKSHNCFSYAMNAFDQNLIQMCQIHGNCRQRFHQPGAKSGDRFALNSTERRTCKVVEKLQQSDVPDLRKTTFYNRCPRGTSKIALVVDEGEDYHYYRQDADGMWSHKDGSNKVKRFDALKRPIFNPEYASRDYRWQGSDLNYEDFCGFYCVPRDRVLQLGQGGASSAGQSWKSHHSSAATRRVRRSRVPL